MNKCGLFCHIRKANPYRGMAKALRTNKVAGNAVERNFKGHDVRKVLLTDINFTHEVLAYEFGFFIPLLGGRPYVGTRRAVSASTFDGNRDLRTTEGGRLYG